MPPPGDHHGAVRRLLAEWIDFGPPSGSVSFASTAIALAAASSSTVAAVVHRRRRLVDADDCHRHRGRAAARRERVRECVRRRPRRAVAVARVRLIRETRSAARDRHGAVRRLGDGVSIWASSSGSVSLARASIALRAGVLGDRGGVVHRGRIVVDAGHGDRDRGGRAARCERVGKRVGLGPGGLLQKFAFGCVGEAAPPACDHDRAVGRLRHRADRFRPAVDVRVVCQHADRARAGVLIHGRAVVYCHRRIVGARDGHGDRGRRAAVQGVGKAVRARAGGMLQ